jgi:hypothetical protein
VNPRRKPLPPGTSLSRRSVVVSITGIALLILTIAALLLHAPGRSRSSAREDEGASFLPLGVQDYGLGHARKFSKGFDRLVYPYSVVSGGVANAAEVRRAVLQDPVVRAHYRRLDLGRLRPVILDQDKAAYVSYRKADKVFWTAKKIRLFKGEALLTDGSNTVRGRCGNLVSDSHMAMASAEEPPEEVLNTPDLPTGALALLQPSYAMDPSEVAAPEDTPLPDDIPLPVAPGPDPEPASGQPAGPVTQTLVTPPMLYGGTGVPLWINSAGTPGSSSPPTTPPGTATTTGGGGTTPPATQPPALNPPRFGIPSLSPPGGISPHPGPEPPLPPSVAPPRTFPGSPSPIPPFFTGPPTTGRRIPDPTPPEPTPPDPGAGPGPGPDPGPQPTPSDVPEPSSWLLAGAGMLGLLWLAHSNRRRGRSRSRLE